MKVKRKETEITYLNIILLIPNKLHLITFNKKYNQKNVSLKTFDNYNNYKRDYCN